MLLAQPPPEGAEAGIFGPDIFAGEVFEVQGFDDYDYSNFEDLDDYEDEDDYFDEDNTLDDDAQDPRQSKTIRFVKTSPTTTTSTTTTTTKRPKLLKFRYRILNPPRRLPYRPIKIPTYRRRY